MAGVAFEGVTKIFGDGTRAVDELDLHIVDGEFMVLVGPSGCGKTTALRMVAGLEEMSSGVIRIGERVVNDLSPKSRDIAMVFQSYALYPHLTVYDNIAFALKIRRLPKAEIQRRVEEAARILDLQPHLNRKPRALSGGQRQRVAMGRAIVRQPQAFLMDEPLSNLDAKLRVEMRAEIARLQRELGVTTIYVTHDQVEAMTLGDRVAIMRDGVLQQVEAPQRLYDRPRNLFVAEFIGSPAMNLMGVDLERANSGFVARFAGSEHLLDVGDRVLEARPALKHFEGKRIILGVRPEDIEDAELAGGAPDGRRLTTTVDIREDMGSEVFAHFGVGGKAVRGEDVKAAVGQEAAEVADVQGNVWVGRLDRDTNAREGRKVDLLVDTNRLHFFDPATGDAIYGAD